MASKSLMRREFIAGAVVAAGVAATGAKAGHHEAGGHHHSGDAKLADAANACVAAGNHCTAHCFSEFKAGRSELAQCAARVEELVASCAALATLAAQDSEHLPAFAGVAAAICGSCEEECRKHAKMHVACKRCAEACAACKEQCERVAQTG